MCSSIFIQIALILSSSTLKCTKTSLMNLNFVTACIEFLYTKMKFISFTISWEKEIVLNLLCACKQCSSISLRVDSIYFNIKIPFYSTHMNIRFNLCIFWNFTITPLLVHIIYSRIIARLHFQNQFFLAFFIYKIHRCVLVHIK